MVGEFQAGLFDCFSDFSLCMCSFCCPCVQFGKNLEALESSDWFLDKSCFLNGLVYYVMIQLGVALLHTPVAIFHTLARQEIRKKKHLVIEDTVVSDFFTVWCCPWCALQQVRAVPVAPFLLDFAAPNTAPHIRKRWRSVPALCSWTKSQESASFSAMRKNKRWKGSVYIHAG